MFLVELVLQGVRGTRELARLRFRDGFNMVSAGNESGKTTAVDAIERLLFPSARTGLLEALVSRHTPDASRAALVMYSDDGAYYRIIQDFSKQAVNLSKYNAGTKDFTLLYKDWDSAVQFMTGITTGISEEDFAKIFIFRHDYYAGHSGAPTAPVQTPHARPARPASSAPRKTAANQTKLAELRESLRKAEEAADVEYKAQSSRLALDEIRKKIAALEELEQKKDEYDMTLAGLKGCEGLPEDLSSLIDDLERRQGQKAADSEELNQELEGLKMQLAGVPAVNLFTDKLFIAGGALGTLSILAGVFVLTAEQALYFPIGVLLSLGLMAAGWYSGSRKNAQRNAVLKDAEALEHDIAELEKRFEQDGASIRACMQATGSATVGDLKEKADNYRHFLSLREDIEEQRNRILGELTPESLQQEYEKRQVEAMELEKAARAVAAYNVDTYSIRQDIERLEGDSSQGGFSADLSEPVMDLVEAPATSAGQDGFYAELGIASRIGGVEMETLVPAVEAAAQRNLSAVTNGRYVRIEVGQDGGQPVLYAKDDSPVSGAELSHGTRDLVYFCLRTGLVEALAGKRRLPFILDDPLAGFDPARQKIAGQILRTLGAKTQVVLFTSNPALRAEGDAASELK
jgi:uncharacterized protein YhaN